MAGWLLRRTSGRGGWAVSGGEQRSAAAAPKGRAGGTCIGAHFRRQPCLLPPFVICAGPEAGRRPQVQWLAVMRHALLQRSSCNAPGGLSVCPAVSLRFSGVPEPVRYLGVVAVSNRTTDTVCRQGNYAAVERQLPQRSDASTAALAIIPTFVGEVGPMACDAGLLLQTVLLALVLHCHYVPSLGAPKRRCIADEFAEGWQPPTRGSTNMVSIESNALRVGLLASPYRQLPSSHSCCIPCPVALNHCPRCFCTCHPATTQCSVISLLLLLPSCVTLIQRSPPPIKSPVLMQCTIGGRGETDRS